MVMNKFLNDEMMQKMVEAIIAGKTFTFNSDNVQIKITPNGMQILYTETPKTSNKDEEIKIFLEYCDKLDDEFFVEVCDTFSGAEMEKLQEQLDTDDYQKTIDLFTSRIKEVGNTRLSEIINAYDAEIKIQEHKIESAKKRIEEIHTELDRVNRKYTC